MASFPPEINPFKHGSKSWDNFYKAYLSHRLQNLEPSKTVNFLHLLHLMCVFSKKYLRESKKTTKVVFPCNLCPEHLRDFHRVPSVIKRWTYARDWDLKNTTGELIIESRPEKCEATSGGLIWWCAFDQRKNMRVSWLVVLDPKTSMKMSFLKIVVPSRFQGICSQKQSFAVDIIFPFQRQNFIFCGVVASFELYPPSHKFQLILTCTEGKYQDKCFTRYVVQMFVSLIDNCTVKSDPQVRDISHQMNQSVTRKEVFFLNQGHVVSSFLVSVSKLCFLEIAKQTSEVLLVHDGPTRSSPLLKCSNNLIRTKTFQAFLVLLLQHHKIRGVKFKSQKIPISNSVFLKPHFNESILVSITDLEFEPIATKFSAANHLQAKVSLQKMIFSGLKSASCMYGGIATLEKENQEIISLCDPDTGQQTMETFIHLLLNCSQSFTDTEIWEVFLLK